MKIIKIGATWCNGCHVMKPRWQEIESEIPGLVTEFYDYDEEPEIMRKYNVDKNLPVAIFLDKSGQEITRFTGETEKDVLLQAIAELRTN